MEAKINDTIIIEELRRRLREAEEALDAIRNGEVDAIVVNGEEGDKIFSLSNSETPYRLIFEEMDEGAVIINSNGTILYSNPRLINLIEDSENHVAGSNLKKYVVSSDKARFSRLLVKAKAGRANGVITFKSGRSPNPVHLNLSLRAVPEGISGDICIIASDVTNLRQNQLQLKKLVKKRTLDLEKANEILRKELITRKKNELDLRENEERLKDLVATKDKFFNIVAHDLKNPFTSLIGASELLTKNVEQMNFERISDLASIFNDAAKNGYAILENLLDWSRSQTGMLKYDPSRLKLRSLVDEYFKNFCHSFNQKEIKFYTDVDEDIFVFADQYMIKTVLRNLISNAIKFTYRKGEVIVKATEVDGHVIVSVKDNGIGISKENIGKIFRIDSKFSLPGTEKEIGTGLGLKLCREFVEKQGGKIWVESVENSGSEFKFSIPNMEQQNN